MLNHHLHWILAHSYHHFEWSNEHKYHKSEHLDGEISISYIYIYIGWLNQHLAWWVWWILTFCPWLPHGFRLTFPTQDIVACDGVWRTHQDGLGQQKYTKILDVSLGMMLNSLGFHWDFMGFHVIFDEFWSYVNGFSWDFTGASLDRNATWWDFNDF